MKPFVHSVQVLSALTNCSFGIVLRMKQQNFDTFVVFSHSDLQFVVISNCEEFQIESHLPVVRSNRVMAKT